MTEKFPKNAILVKNRYFGQKTLFLSLEIILEKILLSCFHARLKSRNQPFYRNNSSTSTLYVALCTVSSLLCRRSFGYRTHPLGSTKLNPQCLAIISSTFHCSPSSPSHACPRRPTPLSSMGPQPCMANATPSP